MSARRPCYRQSGTATNAGTGRDGFAGAANDGRAVKGREAAAARNLNRKSPSVVYMGVIIVIAMLLQYGTGRLKV